MGAETRNSKDTSRDANGIRNSQRQQGVLKRWGSKVFLGASHQVVFLQITGDHMRDYILNNINYIPPQLVKNNKHKILILMKSFDGCNNPENHIMNSRNIVDNFLQIL